MERLTYPLPPATCYFCRSLGLTVALAITTAVFVMLSQAGRTETGSVQVERQFVRITQIGMAAVSFSAPQPSFIRPEAPPVSAPSVDIARGDPSESSHSSAAVILQTLPARADPASPNEEPSFPAGFQDKGQVGPIVVIATLLVLEDGSVDDAKIVGTSGFPELDDAALSFVKRYWRFLPALRDGKPIKDRITVEVLFKHS